MTGIERYTLDVIQRATNPYHLILGSQSTASDKAAQVGHQHGWLVGRVTGPRIVAEQVGTGLYLRRHRRAIRGVHYFSLAPGLLDGGSCPFSVTIHDVSAWRLPETMSPGMRYLYKPLLEQALGSRQLRGIVTVSQFSREEISAVFRIPRTRIEVVYQTTDYINRIAPEPVPGVSIPYFLHVGTIEPRKNIAMLLQSVVAARRSDTWLYLVGRQGWGAMSPLPANVGYLGSVTDGQLVWLYRHAQAVISTSHYEGAGLSMAEALACGCPVFVRDIPVYRELYYRHPNAHFFMTSSDLTDLIRREPAHIESFFTMPVAESLDDVLSRFHGDRPA